MSVASGPTSPTARPGPARRIAVWVLLVVAVAILAWLLATRSDSFLGNDDFVQYWAAARLNQAGDNPYDAEKLWSLQRSWHSVDSRAVRMWNPPWVLPLVAPFALLPYPQARSIWFLVSLVAVMTAGYLAWDASGGPRSAYPVAAILIVLFAPTLFTLKMGQISGFVLLGVAGFLYAASHERWILAGCFASLLTIKPHYLYLFWVALVLWSLRAKKCRALVASAAAVLVALALAMLTNVTVLHQYCQAALSDPLHYWAPPTFGTLLRLAWGHDRHWLQFIPMLIGLIWVLCYWNRHSKQWDWTDHLPLLISVSAVTAPYGWSYDLVVLVPAIMHVALLALRGACRPAQLGGIALYGMINLIAIWQNLTSVGELFYVWMPSALLWSHLLMLAVIRRVQLQAKPLS